MKISEQRAGVRDASSGIASARGSGRRGAPAPPPRGVERPSKGTEEPARPSQWRAKTGPFPKKASRARRARCPLPKMDRFYLSNRHAPHPRADGGGDGRQAEHVHSAGGVLPRRPAPPREEGAVIGERGSVISILLLHPPLPQGRLRGLIHPNAELNRLLTSNRKSVHLGSLFFSFQAVLFFVSSSEVHPP